MNVPQPSDYQRIEAAIIFIRNQFRQQPSLEEIAAHVHLSPYHFQRMFHTWAGTTPKKFLQYTSLEYARYLLRDNQVTLFDAAVETGLSGTGRLHDLFVGIEGMTPAEYKSGGAHLSISFAFYDSPFGKLMVASTAKGICSMVFEEDGEKAIRDLKTRFPQAAFRHQPEEMHRQALSVFEGKTEGLPGIKLHLKGSPFQLKVWEALLRIPSGRLSTYGRISEEIGQPGASRAVGTAIGSNPVAYLIPCHRVIQTSGHVGGYMWGPDRKTMMIGWEAARKDGQGSE